MAHWNVTSAEFLSDGNVQTAFGWNGDLLREPAGVTLSSEQSVAQSLAVGRSDGSHAAAVMALTIVPTGEGRGSPVASTELWICSAQAAKPTVRSSYATISLILCEVPPLFSLARGSGC
jgi:hypothetical protein